MSLLYTRFCEKSIKKYTNVGVYMLTNVGVRVIMQYDYKYSQHY